MADEQQNDTNAGLQWVDGLINRYPEFATVDDEGNRYMTDGQRKQLRNAIQDIVSTEETLQGLTPDDAQKKLLSNPRVYHPKVRERVFGESFVQTIKKRQAKMGLYSY